MSEQKQYGVARGEKILGDLFPTVADAREHLATIENALKTAGLESDVNLVEVDVKTVRSKPRVYKEPVQSTGDNENLGADGVWGSEA